MIFEIILEIVLEGLVDAAGNPKIPKPVRYVIITAIYIIFCGLFVGLALFAFESAPIFLKLIMWFFAVLSTVLFIIVMQKIARSKT